MIENSRPRPEQPKKRSGTDLFREQVSFRQPFDGTQPVVSPPERAAVSLKFQSVVDDTLLRHIDSVRFIGDLDNAFLTVDLDGINKVGVTVSHDEGSTRSMIHVQHEIGDKGGEHFNYRLDKTGAVVRYDSRDIPDVAESFEEFRAKSKEEIEGFLSTVRGNGDLERTMGFNEQPISIDEMQCVIDLVNLATPRTDLDL